MTVQAPWRDLRSVMVATFVVAVVATMTRHLGNPDREDGWIEVWLALTIALAGIVCWPIGLVIASAMAPAEDIAGLACPTCQRRDVRPIVTAGSGIFHPVSRYRCADCRTIFQMVDGKAIVESVWSNRRTVDPTGIEFLDSSATLEEICYVDEPAKSPE